MALIDHRRSLLAAEIYVDEAARPVTDAASAAEAAKPGGGARVLSFFLQTFVMAVALVLFFIFAGVAAVFLLHLCVVGRAFRSRRRSVGPAATDRVPGDARPGLSDAQMKDLPWFEYVVRSACSQCPPPECAVCMEGVRMGERCRALPPCGHVFHVSCVDRWLVRVLCSLYKKLSHFSLAGCLANSLLSWSIIPLLDPQNSLFDRISDMLNLASDAADVSDYVVEIDGEVNQCDGGKTIPMLVRHVQRKPIWRQEVVDLKRKRRKNKKATLTSKLDHDAPFGALGGHPQAQPHLWALEDNLDNAFQT
ncbi:hypothetical protein ZIOFF_035685 [Zingiber officinale]|uniref:RING-type domain-containing protein n=1 Tax=Zingiber officinale TaxID=94328 RepID=A0A8J5G9I5_ZINOF|nr:hypothetical protein ZIOFF_035685 [Zingiber officinale]